MSMKSTDRRGFLRRTAAVVAAAPALLHVVRAAEPNGRGAVRLGAPLFNPPQDPEALAQAHRKRGYRAAYCPDVKLSDGDRIRDLVAAFAKHDVVIAEVGRWCNLLDQDAAKREANMKAMIDGLALAEAVGARCCVNIAGSYNPSIWYGPHPDNITEKFFDAAVENARKIIDAVKPKRTKLCYEATGWSLPDGPDSYLRMVKAIDRAGFGVHLDPCNMVNSPARFYRNADLLNECFDKLGPWIASCHAKDLTWDVEMNVHFREVGPCAGSIDFTTFLRRLAALPGEPPLMIEHLGTEEEYDQSRRRLFELGGKIGVRFG